MLRATDTSLLSLRTDTSLLPLRTDTSLLPHSESPHNFVTTQDPWKCEALFHHGELPSEFYQPDPLRVQLRFYLSGQRMGYSG
ncbi:hypothetical protein NDU88_000178 [Pleurodeles waltl]|uniref:Uncharacterized protein n=1 Tax=Pleurodeles waltl TaxID=8319 RepID=A0AAV7WEP6_PLEWA|nr:hypothetical protein NDU88_000178 [Pleurodeles waltl]